MSEVRALTRGLTLATPEANEALGECAEEPAKGQQSY